eukprot:2318016-Amphidinium_carterae.1
MDVKNAFNMVDRDAFLKAVRHHFPRLVPFVDLCYGRNSVIQFGDCGVGGESSHCFATWFGPFPSPLYLDDGIVGGRVDVVRTLLEDLEHIGLTLQPAKCEVVPTGPGSTTVTPQHIP